MNPPPMRVIGLMSGTSLDGFDAIAVDFSYKGEGHLEARVVDAEYTPYPAELEEGFLRALPPNQVTMADVCALDTEAGQEAAQAAKTLSDRVGGCDLVCTHGQTVYHWVSKGRTLGTLQIGQPAWIAEEVGTPVVSDLRVADVARGGTGAPLVAFLDALLLPEKGGALNLGGIANLTVKDTEKGSGIQAFDTGPANALVDALVQETLPDGDGFDKGGALALQGTVNEEWLAVLLEDTYYAQAPPKTTGKEHFNWDYVTKTMPKDLVIEDAAATLTELSARSVADQVERLGVEQVFVSGGGIHNAYLMNRIRELLLHTVVAGSDALGLDPDYKEAFLCALIGWCTMHGVPASVPTITGASEAAILGTISPNGPLRMPPTAEEITSLIISS